MSVGDVYELVDVQTLKGQEVLNVYQYQQIGAVVPLDPTPNIAAVLAYEYSVGPLLGSLRSVQSPELEHTAIRVRNLFDGSDVYDLVGSWPGASGGAPAIDSTFNAVGFVESLNNGLVKPGHKRYAGLTDDVQTDGVITGSGALGVLATMGTELGQNIQVGLIIRTDGFEPGVCKRIRSGVAGDYHYRFPTSSGELVWGKIIEAAFNILITSQVSRKIGVGA